MPRNWNTVAERSEGRYTVDDCKQAFHQLLTHQCLYRRFPHHSVSYRLISDNRPEYQEACELAGYRLSFKDNYEFCSIVPETAKHTQLDLQQTVFLLVLRRLYHDHGTVGDLTPEGDALVSAPQLLTVYEEMLGKPLEKGQATLKALVKTAWQSGLAREVGTASEDPQPFAIAILPGIAEVLSETVVGRFGAHLKATLAIHEAASATTSHQAGANTEEAAQ